MSMEQAGKIIDRIKNELQLFEERGGYQYGDSPCGLPEMRLSCDMEIKKVYCDSKYHHIKIIRRGVPVVEFVDFCPRPEEEEFQEHLKEIREQYGDMIFDTFQREAQPDAFNKAVAFCLKPSKRFIFSGTTGTGKTHLARAMFVELCSHRKTCRWQTAPVLADLFRKIQPIGEETQDKRDAKYFYSALLKCHFVFIDDLGSERETQSDIFTEQLKLLIDELNGSLIITTNLDSKQMVSRYGEKILSRLLEKGDAIVMTGTDYRKKEFRK